MVIGILVIYSSWALLKETVAVLMEGAPGHINVDAVRDSIVSVPGVQAVHDLHVWTITSGMVALSEHVVVQETPFSPDVLPRVREVLPEKFEIDHATIQTGCADFQEPGTLI